MLNKKPKAIIFDWDSTLADTGSATTEALNIILPHFKLGNWEQEKQKRDPRKSLKNNFPIIFGKDLAKEAYKIYSDEYSKKISKIKLMPYAKEMLDNLTKTDIKLILISNKDRDLLKKEITVTGVENIFHIIISGDEVTECKPSTEPVKLALNKLNIKADKNVWMVGDLVDQDIISAENAGCQPILFSERYKRKYSDIVNDKVAKGLLFLVKDHKELDDLIRKVTG